MAISASLKGAPVDTTEREAQATLVKRRLCAGECHIRPVAVTKFDPRIACATSYGKDEWGDHCFTTSSCSYWV